jgi:homoserine kinase type II
VSVFTLVRPDQLEAFLSGYALGGLVDYSGIAGGSENSNFFVTTSKGRYVLTLIEREPVARELPFFIELLDVLHAAGLPVPYALRDRQGRPLQQLNGKPALLQPRLPGVHVDTPTVAQCAAVGNLLAQIHLATAASGLYRRDDRGINWLLEEGCRQSALLDAPQRELLQQVLDSLARWQARPPVIPSAVLHADLFRDNLMFEQERLSGVIDFYNAASGWCLYDLAIACNDWCLSGTAEAHLEPDLERAAALLGGYAALRPFTDAERNCWQDMLGMAAARFWLSRRIAAAEHGGQSGVLIKDPEHFVRVLQAHRRQRVELP